MSKTPTVINPMTQKPLPKDAAKLVPPVPGGPSRSPQGR